MSLLFTDIVKKKEEKEKEEIDEKEENEEKKKRRRRQSRIGLGGRAPILRGEAPASHLEGGTRSALIF